MIVEGAPLAPKTTLGVGGPARFWIEARSIDEVRGAIDFARDRGLPLVVLGGGSNVLVADRGVEGVVLRPRIEREDVVLDGERARLVVGAGVAWDPFVARTVERGFAGLECLAGIPGDVGATPIQNVGAYGREVGEHVREVRAIDRASGALTVFDRTSMRFGYRDSVLKREEKDKHVLVEVVFELPTRAAPIVRYAELERKLADEGRPRTLAAVRETVIELRRGKSMVLDPADENRRSAGSFFTNPIVDRARADEVEVLAAKAGVLGAGEKMPRFDADGGRVKLAAGWLIERAGFTKGFGEGRVGLSTRHALAVVNRGGATAREIVAFAGGVRRGVFDRFGVELEPEPVLVGFDPGEADALLAPLAR